MTIIFPTERVTDLDEFEGSQLHSVVRGRNDYDLCPPADLSGSVEADRQIDLFLLARHAVKAGFWPYAYFEELGINPDVPAMFAHVGVTANDPVSAARLVDHTMDHPFDLHGVFLHYLGTPTLKVDQDIRRPQSAGVDFLGFRELDARIATTVHAALVEAFQVKYFFAHPRPEHHFESGSLVAEYPCPPHPSYVAGHGAIAGAIVQTWIDNVELDVSQIEDITHAGEQYAHYRTLAGVHWAEDNDAGFVLGRKVSAL